MSTNNPGLGEYHSAPFLTSMVVYVTSMMRFNKLLREKGHALAGLRIGPKMIDHEGKEVPGNHGYKYFGAAKDLPGVRELFEKEPTKSARIGL